MIANDRVATMDVSAILFAEWCKASKSTDLRPRRFTVVDNSLPDDAEVVSLRAEDNGVIRLLIRSASFDEVPAYQQPPMLPQTIYKTVYDEL